MNTIKEILHKYLTPEQIELCAMEGQIHDWAWLVNNGYYIDTRSDMDQLTEKGKAYQERFNKRVDEIFDKHTQEDWRRQDKGKKELLAMEQKTPQQKWGKLLKSLTEQERWAVRYLTTVTW